MRKLKLFLAATLLAPALVLAGANDVQLVQRNPTDTGTVTRLMATPGDGLDRLFFFNGSSLLPGYLSLGVNLTSGSGILDAVGADWNSTTGQPGFILNKPSTFAPSAHTHPASQISDSTATGRAVLTATDAAAARSAISAGTVSSITAGTGLSGGTITGSGTLSLPNVGTASTYSGVTTDAQGRITAGTVRSFAYQTRALNTCFQPSASRDTFATYAVDISASLSLSGGTVGTVYLRTYTNSGCSTGVQEVTRFVNGNTGSLTVGLNTTQNATGTLSGIIPAGLWVQLVTENTTGTPAFTARPGQEVQL